MAAFPGRLFYVRASVHVHFHDVSVAVLIALAEDLPTAQPAAEAAEMLAFTDTEVARALDVIVERRPRLVIVNQAFAATAPGTALIDRIKDDSALRHCEVRIVAFGESPAPLDLSGTRRAPRFAIASGIDVDIDGKPASLVNLSLVGAQVLSATILKPKQRVRFTLLDEGRAIRFPSLVASVAVEIVKGAPRYRAGVEFVNPDGAALQRFIDRHKR
jgi:hypothetical protein